MKVPDDFCRKAINFDLNTESLKKIFKSNNPFVYLSAYRKIGKFLKNNGFEHRQWSGYISKQPLTPIQVTAIVKGLNKALPWLRQCVKKFDVTDIGKQHDLMYIFQKTEKTKLQEKISEQHLGENSHSDIKEEKQNSREQVAKEYGLSRNTVARLLRIDKLCDGLKQWVDDGLISIRAGVELSYLSKENQEKILKMNSAGTDGNMRFSISESQAKELRALYSNESIQTTETTEIPKILGENTEKKFFRKEYKAK